MRLAFGTSSLSRVCTLCGSQDNLQRVQIRQMLREWDRRHQHFSRYLPRAAGVIVPNEAGKEQLLRYFPVEQERVELVVGAVDFVDAEHGWVAPLDGRIYLAGSTRSSDTRPARRSAGTSTARRTAATRGASSCAS